MAKITVKLRRPSDTVKLNLRFSEELRRRLERAAEKNNQSMNLEIVARLEASFRKEDILEVVKEAVRTEIERQLPKEVQ